MFLKVAWCLGSFLFVFNKIAFALAVPIECLWVCAQLSVCFAFFFAGQYYKALPYILMGGLALSGSLLCLLLPESFRKPLPETIPQMQLLCK